MATAQARVATERPGRYAKQLTSHMSRRCETSWDEETGTGTISFPGTGAVCTLTSETHALVLDLDAADLDRFEELVGRHLGRFGATDRLVVAWRRADGADGTTQGPYDPDERRPERRD
ncbi:DUF2218 domain-containing protein [Propionibacterium australiense]|uniref:DUF2218 domain-containing protein n=1 Tax=Propionibacterium australiense TaxID=119981 RepID=A0A383S740_9ACTN|nr:DUF2218 domain-containing protein [Propionibacterium australiense]RLP08498.1 DUF2218 domain-containing protein [Propionibacterium australiense]RLP08566.1 DUF2218 domain-containing protein [Propionibacterium australiense]SYZ33653.1 Uncharacterized protein conserved in bacteria (DUF2218) [Propionibacterium australiense]VEH88876.1 Uncharacterized protein conserved in bacteria (DUF2218) [Propionibacterium australiense]